MAPGLTPWSPPFSAGFSGELVWSGLVGAIEARLPVKEWDGAVVELPTVASGISWWACMGSAVLLEEMLPVVVEGVVPGAAKSVLLPVGTFVGRVFGGWSFMSSKPEDKEDGDSSGREWGVEPVTAAAGDSLLSVVFLPCPTGRAVPNHELLPISPVFDDGSVVAVVGSVLVTLLVEVLDDLPGREEVCLSLSESTRGSALLARSEA